MPGHVGPQHAEEVITGEDVLEVVRADAQDLEHGHVRGVCGKGRNQEVIEDSLGHSDTDGTANELEEEDVRHGHAVILLGCDGISDNDRGLHREADPDARDNLAANPLAIGRADIQQVNQTATDGGDCGACHQPWLIPTDQHDTWGGDQADQG